MKTSFTILSALLTSCLLLPADAMGQSDLFFSAGSVGSGLVVNRDLDLIVTQGDTVSIYAFWSTNGPAESDLDIGGGLDLDTSQNGIIAFNSASTSDFDIVFTSTPDVSPFTRWDSSNEFSFVGPAQSVNPNSIVGLDAFTLPGVGIRQFNDGSGPLLDTGYDADGDAFLFGEFEFTALEVGTVDIFASRGTIGFAGGGGQALVPTFGGISINVISVPEPNSAFFIVSTLGMLSFMRRRKLI